MKVLNRKDIERDYKRIKSEFQTKNILQVSYKVASQIKEHKELLKEIFTFLTFAFKGKLRNDGRTPLVFHSVYLTRLAYLCGERSEDSLLTVALHDVLEDTEISEEILMKEKFMMNKKHLLGYLRTLSEDKSLSREPDGKNLPPRYYEHIKRIVGAPKEVINTEIIDRFSDLMDLEYITILDKEEKELRLKAKIIKVRSFVENITRNRKDFNMGCLNLFESKVRDLEEEWAIKVDIPLIVP